MALIVSGLLVVVSCVFLLSHFPIKGRVSYLLAGFLLAVGLIVLLFEVLSLFRGLTRSAVWLADIILFLASVVLWLLMGRKSLSGPFASAKRPDLARLLRDDWPLLIMAFLVFVALALLGLQSWLLPDGTADTVGYHFPRLALWEDARTIILPRETAVAITDLRVLEYPPVSEILYLWAFFSAGTLRAANFIEFLCLFPLMLSIFGIARTLTGDTRASAYAALSYALFGGVILNTQVAQSVLSSAALFITGLYFFIRALERTERSSVFFCCLALALAAGTKPTVYFMLPGLALVFLFFLRRKETRKQLGLWLGIGAISLALFSSQVVFQNLVAFGTPAGRFMEANSPVEDRLECVRYNSLRYAYELILPYPMPAAWQENVEGSYEAFGRRLGDLFNTPLEAGVCRKTFSDPFTLYGGKERLMAHLFFPLLLLAGLVASFMAWRRQRDPWRPALLLLLVTYYLVLSGAAIYSVWKYRYGPLPLALFSILFADFYARAMKSRPASLALVLLSLVTGALYMEDIFLPSLPKIGERLAANSTVGEGNSAADFLQPEARVLLLPSGFNTFDSAFWGDDLSRQVDLTTCDDLLEDLAGGEYDAFLYSWLTPYESFEACLGTYQTDRGNPLRDLLQERYLLVKESWFRYSAVRAYQSLDNVTVDETVLYPATLDIIRIHPAYQRAIGAGPVLINTRTRDATGETTFSLRAHEGGQQAAIAIELFGLTCDIEDGLMVTVRSEDGSLLLQENKPIMVRWGDYRELAFTLDLAPGINRVTLGDPACTEALNPPLYISSVHVAPDITPPNIQLQGAGWFGLEFTAKGQPFRWANNDAAFSLAINHSGDFILTIGVQSGSGYAGEPFTLEIRDDAGEVVGSAEVTGQWSEVSIPLTLPAGEHLLFLHSEGGGLPAENDGRTLNFLVTGIALSQPPGE